MKRWMSFAAVAVAFAFPGLARAATISTLFNTGVDGSHNTLADGTVGDPHYALVSKPATSTSTLLIRTSAGGFPIPPYIGDNTTSTWIGPDNAFNLDSPTGDY